MPAKARCCSEENSASNSASAARWVVLRDSTAWMRVAKVCWSARGGQQQAVHGGVELVHGVAGLHQDHVGDLGDVVVFTPERQVAGQHIAHRTVGPSGNGVLHCFGVTQYLHGSPFGNERAPRLFSKGLGVERRS